AHINTLQARTARMSITGIPAQTLPSSDSMIRSCFIADPGELIGSVDYMAQELRVLAALSQDPVMMKAFAEGADLHQITADASGVERKVGKMANFLTVYGGGPGALASQAHINHGTAKKVLDGFNSTYRGVHRFSQKIAADARASGVVWTATGRRLPVDKDRSYSAVNYLVQSTSRDVTGAALVRLEDEGYGEFLRLVIHDEVVVSVPEKGSEEICKEIGEIMNQELFGVS